MLHVYNAVFVKIFKTFERNIILNCQYYTGTLPARYAYDLGRLRFLAAIYHAEDTPAGFLCRYEGEEERVQLGLTYNVEITTATPLILKKKVWTLFESELTQI